MQRRADAYVAATGDGTGSGARRGGGRGSWRVWREAARNERPDGRPAPSSSERPAKATPTTGSSPAERPEGSPPEARGPGRRTAAPPARGRRRRACEEGRSAQARLEVLV